MSVPKKEFENGISVEELLERNKQYAQTEHKKLPDLVSLMGGNPALYGPHILVLSCLDSRSNPYQVLGLKPYEAIVLRHIAGRITSAEFEIAGLDTLFHLTQIIVLQHTNCGASVINPQMVLDSIKQKRPELKDSDYLTGLEGKFPSLDRDSHRGLKYELRAVKESKILRKDLIDNVVGLYLNVDTGLVDRVFEDS